MIKDSLRRLPGIVATLFLLATAACMPESLKPGIETPGSQDRSPMTIDIGVSATEVGIRTRAEGDSRMDNYNVKSIWIGVFDVATDSLVGSRFTEKTFKTETGAHIDSAKVDILYYDAHPTVRIFGVANYQGVKDGNNSKLSDALSKVKSMADLYAISVDTESADLAEKQNNAPLMMGVYKAVGTDDFYTVKSNPNTDGFKYVVGDDYKGMDLKLVEGFQRIDYLKLTGTIRLRRLVSQINVNVNAGKNIDLSNMRYRVFNMPTQVYLQERQTYTGEVKFIDPWKKVSPNKADSLLMTQSVGDFAKVISAKGYKSEAEQSADGLSFSFYHYENKHWGQNVSDQKSREAIRTDKSLMTDDITNKPLPIFLALSPYSATTGGPANDYNNFASYFEITLDVNVKDDNGNIVQSANNVTYRIHEGFVNNENGGKVEGKPNFNDPNDPQNQEAWAEYYEKVAKDFTCVRNTIYNYTITINGLTSITVDTDTGEHTHTNPGVLGNAVLWTNEETFEMNAEEGGDTPKLDNTEIVGYICYYENGGDPMWYGAGDYMPLLSSPALPDLKNVEPIKDPSDAGFSFTIDGQDIVTLFPATKAEAENSAVTIGGIIEAKNDLYKWGNPKNYFHSLYLLKPIQSYDDDCTQYSYYSIHYQPKDERQDMPDDYTFDFSLAFANEWDSEATAENGAVAGHIKDIRLLDPKWNNDNIPAEDIKFKVYIDDEKVADANSIGALDDISIYTSLKNDVGNSIHTVKVVAITDEYKDAEFENKFIVYPTEFEWSYRTYNASYFEATERSSGSYYGSEDYQRYHADETGSNNYYALYQVSSDMANNSDNLQTGGNRTIFHIDPLYDAILTIYASNNAASAQLGRCISVSYSESGEQVSQTQQSSVGFATKDGTPFTFHIDKDKGPVSILSGSTDPAYNGNIRIYAVKLTYHDPAASHKGEWVFSNPEWTEFRNALGSGVTGFGETSINGLHIIGGEGKTLKAGTGYIQLGNTGAPDKCAFWFYAHKTGTLTVERENTDRNLIVATDDGPVGDPLTGQATNSMVLTITKPTKVYLYSGGNSINIKSITYTEN